MRPIPKPNLRLVSSFFGLLLIAFMVFAQACIVWQMGYQAHVVEVISE